MKCDGFKAAAEAKDFESGRDLFTEDVVFNSPFVHTPYEGIDALALLLGNVIQVLEDFRYLAVTETGDTAALIFEARVKDRVLQGVDVLKFNDEGKISEMSVMIRPMTGLAAVGEEMGKRLEAMGVS